MIYLPDLENYNCFVVQNEGVIRAYEETPQNNQTISYRDYYINSSYIYKDGYQSFNQYATLPTCLDNNTVTNDYWYRLDLPSILFIFCVFVFFGVYLPFKIFMRLFKKGGL